MAKDSGRRNSEVKLPIDGMESVIATVSGYLGNERFDLIKLISKAGANYVGSMNQSTTHLVCWKYEGRKYDLAQKFKTVIVNHQWVEDCIKKGRRVPEYPYTFQCGQEVGPLLLNVSSVADKVREQCNLQSEDKELSELEPYKHKPKRETSRGSSRKDKPSIGRYCFDDAPSPGLLRVESELDINKHRRKRETNKGSSGHEKISSSRCCFDDPPSPGLLRVEKKRNSASAEPSCKSRKRRLVKKGNSREILELMSDSEPESHALVDFQEHCTFADFVNNSDDERHEGLHNLNAEENGQNRTEILNDVGETEDVIDVLDCEDQSSRVKGTSLSHITDVDASVGNIEDAPKSPPSKELSCVICMTDFSATRGVLPCGHRFCLSCIESWAYHMASCGKNSMCPLCKASFTKITKVNAAVSSDQKIYSQTVPHDDSRMEIYILPAGGKQSIPSNTSGARACFRCSCQEPVDLLIGCHICHNQYIHSYCMDPPMSPWTCGHCKYLQMLFLTNR